MFFSLKYVPYASGSPPFYVNQRFRFFKSVKINDPKRNVLGHLFSAFYF